MLIEKTVWNIIASSIILFFLLINFSLKLSIDLLLRAILISGIIIEIIVRHIFFIIFYRCRCCREKNCCRMKRSNRRGSPPSKIYEMKIDEPNVQKQIPGNLGLVEYDSHLNLRNSCMICLEIFKEKEKIIKLSCNDDHIFHEECFMVCYQDNKMCPYCRQPIQI